MRCFVFAIVVLLQQSLRKNFTRFGKMLAFLTVNFLDMAQPIIKTSWEKVNDGTGSPYLSGRTDARVATFSDGRYIIVYPISNSNTYYSVVGKIFNADGTIFKAEFPLADSALPTDFLQAPNVAVFEDDT